MKICYIADGNSHHTQRLVNYFASKGHEIHLISSRFNGKYDANIRIYPLSRVFPPTWIISKLLNAFLWLFEVRKLVRKIKPDILDVHFISIPGYLGYASGFHPFIINVWEYDVLVEPKISRFRKLAAIEVLKRADFVTCITKTQFYAAIKYISPAKIRVIPLGVDCEIFKPTPKKKPADIKTIGVIKALQPTYGIEYLIRAVPFIVRDFPLLRVLIIGDGEQKPYRKIAEYLGVEHYVEFIGKVPHEEVPGYLSRMDVFVMPSVYESFGVAALEAQAMEVPVVASRAGGIPEAVNDGVTGILVEPKNPKAIAEAIAKLLADNSLREQMGKRGRELVSRNFNLKVLLEERYNLYKELSGMS